MSNTDYHDFKPILAEIEERPTNPLGTLFSMDDYRLNG